MYILLFVNLMQTKMKVFLLMHLSQYKLLAFFKYIIGFIVSKLHLKNFSIVEIYLIFLYLMFVSFNTQMISML